MKKQKEFNPELNHDILVQNMRPLMSYDENADYSKWKNAIKEKFISLTGLDSIAENACPLNFDAEWTEKRDGYTITRFTFESEVGETVPCYLLIPDTGKKKYPVAITLQGHSTGFHLSIGERKYEKDESYFPRAAFALQAVSRGFAALCIEQRGMGERKPISGTRYAGVNCRYASMAALEIGRTILGERVWDISKAIDVLERNFPACDVEDIFITGNSGGGTASYYAACYDDRIKLSAPSCSFCSYKESILTIAHCHCNYIPFAYKYFDMQDLACLIAPRKLLVTAGKKDTIFPIDGVRRAYETVRKIYAEEGKPDYCAIVETEQAHWWCEDIVWDAIEKMRAVK